jgi:hypothetical protein
MNRRFVATARSFISSPVIGGLEVVEKIGTSEPVKSEKGALTAVYFIEKIPAPLVPTYICPEAVVVSATTHKGWLDNIPDDITCPQNISITSTPPVVATNAVDRGVVIATI